MNYYVQAQVPPVLGLGLYLSDTDAPLPAPSGIALSDICPPPRISYAEPFSFSSVTAETSHQPPGVDAPCGGVLAGALPASDLFHSPREYVSPASTNGELSSDSDPEYVPPARTRRRTSRSKRGTTRVRASSSTPSTPPSPRSPYEDTRLIRTPPRRALGTGDPNYESKNAKGEFCCETCGRTCNPHRRVDFRRHVNTHYPHLRPGAVVCCGVPVELRESYVVAADARVMTVYGREMVGGCGRSLSRSDALGRHLGLLTNVCVGDLEGWWHPPKQG